MPELSLDLQRVNGLSSGFHTAFGAWPNRFFSAPGRTELGGNHTDHQGGHVLAAAITLDIAAAVRATGRKEIRLQSGPRSSFVVSLDELDPAAQDAGTPAALIRGVAQRMRQLGCPVGGFDAYLDSCLPAGVGLSSSAAFSVLLAVVMNGLFGGGKLEPSALAAAAQYAENVHFGKPCGCMDQLASALGGLVAMDFSGKTLARRVNYDFSTCGHALCMVDTRAGHARLTGEYAAVTREMGAVCACFGKTSLSEIAESEFYGAVAKLRKRVGDRAVLRAIHYYQEDRRVPEQVAALETGDFPRFLQLVKQSGYSSYMYLQNVILSGAKRSQPMALVLALCEHYLAGRGAYRVHGGGFAGAVQAFVPEDRLEAFQSGMEDALGKNCCRVLAVRPQGAGEAGPAGEICHG